jgi:alcohol dehydrogenase (cytochrome c)
VTGNGMVVWTNAETGEMLNSVEVADPVATGYSLTAPPLVIGDKLIVPGSGGDRGARAHIDALNAETGEAIWRTYSIPAPGEPGSETWKDDNNAWEHGGGSFWQTGSYDPELNLTYWGTGQPVPMYDPEYRPGDNLFTNSSLALNPDDGSIVWYFQYTPGDFLDYDEIGTQLLFDTTVDGEERKVLGHFGRNGFYYNLDRTNGQFIHASQYVEQLNWTAGIDPKTGKPVEYDPNSDLQTYAIGAASRRAQGDITGCPNIQGGVNFMPTAYSPDTNLAYGAGIEGCSIVSTDPSKAQAPEWNGGGAANADRQTGSITAVDASTGQSKAQRLFDYTSYSGVLSTAGGVVYTTTIDGTIFALDDETLDVLWQMNTGTLSSAPPMSFGVGGKQYIALLLGGNGVVKGFLNKSPELADIQNTSMLLVLGL